MPRVLLAIHLIIVNLLVVLRIRRLIVFVEIMSRIRHRKFVIRELMVIQTVMDMPVVMVLARINVHSKIVLISRHVLRIIRIFVTQDLMTVVVVL